MKFSGENVSSVLGKLKRLAAVRGKLAVNGGKLYQAFSNSKIKISFSRKGAKKRKEGRRFFFASFFASLREKSLGRVLCRRVGVGDEATAAARFVFVRSTNRNTLFGFEGAL